MQTSTETDITLRDKQTESTLAREEDIYLILHGPVDVGTSKFEFTYTISCGQ